MAAQYALRTAQRMQRALRVEWEDGLAAQFTYVWLRDNCEKRPSLLHLDLHAKPQVVDADRHKLSLVWPPFLSSDYSSQFLREHTRVKQPIASAASCPITKKVLTVPWTVLPFAPRNETFAKGHMAAIEWGSAASEAGTVWPQLEQVPSLLTVETDTPGAKLHLVDAVSALSLMSATHPEQFSFLASNPVEYHADLFTAAHRVARIEDGRIVAAVFNNELRSAEITVDCLEMYYQSLKTFHQICLDTMHTVRLDPESVLVVDNTQTFLGAPAQCGRKLSLKIFR